MGEYTQEHRLIEVITPLGKDVLLLQGFHGHESISGLFSFDLTLHSQNRSISFDSIVGKKATIRLTLANGKRRYFNGIISSFSQGGSSATFTHYHATLVPWLWMLTRTSDCRIFQDMTVPDIIEKVFKEQELSDFERRLDGEFEPREYCVQYRETDFNFVSRLMEEEGIFYFFEHGKDKHTLVLANHPSKFNPCRYQPIVNYETIIGEGETDEVVTEWSVGQEVRPGQYEVKDFNFEQPSLDLTASVTGKDERKYEIYDYPGEYKNKDRGEKLVGIRMQEEDTPQVVITGSSTCSGFVSGFKFDLKGHYRRDFNKSYVLTSVYHSADQGTNYRSSETGGGSGFSYTNHFRCIRHLTPFRPPRVTPVPLVQGSQTAIVVGPEGEEIFTDKYGRVKVQFHWDRQGKYNEKSSCWIRVSQNWAGKRWGATFLPRIGQEVIVDFLEGDPDQPIIVGSVYNGEQNPPYLGAGLDSKHRHDPNVSGIKTNSTKDGDGFNEIRFDDSKGKEQVFVHSQRNMDVRVRASQMISTGSDRNLTVGAGSREKVAKNKEVSVGGEMKIEVKGKYNVHVEGDYVHYTEGKQHCSPTSGYYLRTNAKVLIEASQEICFSCGASFISITPAGIWINGPMVYINSGGTPGAEEMLGCNLPVDPAPADDSKSGSPSTITVEKLRGSHGGNE